MLVVGFPVQFDLFPRTWIIFKNHFKELFLNHFKATYRKEFKYVLIANTR